MIPCKANKCLLYPMCQNKTHIDCPEIRSYIQTLYNVPYSKTKVWKIINRDLKNLFTYSGPTIGLQDTIIHKDEEPNTGLDIEYVPRGIK